MSKNLKIFCLKSFLNVVALCLFLAGNIYSNTILIIIGGSAMILVSFILYRQFLNPLIAIVLGVFLALIMSPWYLGVFWAVSIYLMFQIITLLHNLFTKPNFLKTRFNSN
ncbi:hypothetical protein MWU58_12410 [Flavobacteriaceae bacterium S0825]|uniref:hypothetical protein n=1 Tax=Gaetbulibacter sp. S0825 TaxID=2720084 RepID=UPI0014305C67|nr:hypothetical protein [Gaetbulibacter sp. S0825]MCK0110101.1 hypothetical protein [Flavobacteriaceae bacterium S0825]NIX65730.1 hypothetical protein [Gaetbulibacter sp. S0825]